MISSIAKNIFKTSIPIKIHSNATRSMHSNVVDMKVHLAGSVNQDQVKFAAKVLKEGCVIAVPTDTVYGLAAKVSNPKGLEKIYKIKGRDPSKPLSVCVSSLESIEEIAQVPESVKKILPYLLPGQVTLVFERSPNLNKDLNPDIPKIGIRLIDNIFITSLCHYAGPLALTSANKSGKESAIAAEEFEELWPEIDYVFRDPYQGRIWSPIGTLENLARAGSTVVDLSEPQKYKIIRDGCSSGRVINLLTRFGYRRV